MKSVQHNGYMMGLAAQLHCVAQCVFIPEFEAHVDAEQFEV